MAKRTLVLMRHAKSSWETDEADIRRPLSARGKRDADAAGRALAQQGLTVDVALISPATRAQETWAGVQAGGVDATDIRTVEAIYHHDAADIVSALRDLDDSVQTVMVVGHSPTIHEAVELIARRDATKDWFALDTKYPTSGIAIIELDERWSDIAGATGTLVAFTVPRG